MAMVFLTLMRGAGANPAVKVAPGYDKAIEDYVRFLDTHKQTPVDYIMGLFGKYDIVVLCERAHPETTQYDMLFELAGDKRFQQWVASVRISDYNNKEIFPKNDCDEKIRQWLKVN